MPKKPPQKSPEEIAAIQLKNELMRLDAIEMDYPYWYAKHHAGRAYTDAMGRPCVVSDNPYAASWVEGSYDHLLANTIGSGCPIVLWKLSERRKGIKRWADIFNDGRNATTTPSGKKLTRKQIAHQIENGKKADLIYAQLARLDESK